MNLLLSLLTKTQHIQSIQAMSKVLTGDFLPLPAVLYWNNLDQLHDSSVTLTLSLTFSVVLETQVQS